MSNELKPRTTTVILFQGDDLDKIRDEQQRLEAATSAALSVSGAPKRLGDSPDVQAAAKTFDAFMDECVARAVSVEIQALGRKAWRDMLAKHPPRKITVTDESGAREAPDPDDEGWGFNYETLGDDLVPASVVDKVAFPEAWLDLLADGDFSKIYSAAVLLNQGAGPNPTWRAALRLGPTSSETTESPSRLA